jgi:hypothetical protein
MELPLEFSDLFGFRGGAGRETFTNVRTNIA